MGISPECDICLRAAGILGDMQQGWVQVACRCEVFVMTRQIKYLFYTDFSGAKQMTSSYSNDKLKSVFFEQNWDDKWQGSECFISIVIVNKVK